MRYLLVVGFYCEVYRKEPRARIFVGDRLVDEFSIPHTPSNLYRSLHEFGEKCHPLQPYAYAEMDNLWIKHHPPLKFYELQIDDEISNLAIRIDIDNHDSDYSNGFMTRSTLIRLEMCNFFPLEHIILQRFKKIIDKRRISENYAWYRSFKNIVFDLGRYGMCWQGENGKKIINTKNILSRHNIGGDGSYVCNLIKKYGILIPTLARASRHTFNYSVTDYLFDKYFQHANQRDSS